ncbi:hypothetical protein KC19_VG140500 [Ceratodon purpureus]|uniref:Uncharacterized protein n=1 Tax=Ceratodon purpureus TaxID=3225 RepID=A0A8T0HQF0_CERPU|nr:hypothetical protein KC19_VG140500 [Ceratodon purpureus]
MSMLLSCRWRQEPDLQRLRRRWNAWRRGKVRGASGSPLRRPGLCIQSWCGRLMCLKWSRRAMLLVCTWILLLDFLSPLHLRMQGSLVNVHLRCVSFLVLWMSMYPLQCDPSTLNHTPLDCDT